MLMVSLVFGGMVSTHLLDYYERKIVRETLLCDQCVYFQARRCGTFSEYAIAIFGCQVAGKETDGVAHVGPSWGYRGGIVRVEVNRFPDPLPGISIRSQAGSLSRRLGRRRRRRRAAVGP